MIRLSIILSLSFLIVGCGQEGDRSNTNPPNAKQASTDLVITLPDGTKDRLLCPGPDKRCQQINPQSLKPLSPDTVCGQVYGGPETARIEGVVEGRSVNLQLSRTDSCKIAQWDDLAWLLNQYFPTNKPS